MRIVAGTMRGRTIEAPAGTLTRPTTDRVREALFSSLYSLRGGFEGAIVLDAFAGSGALGLEAPSRGAERVVFFERDSKAAAVLKRNIEACKLSSDCVTLVRRDLFQALPLSQTPPFDLVFLDPPYDYEPNRVLTAMARLACAGALSSEVLIAYEHALKTQDELQMAAHETGFEVYSFNKYGKTAIAYIKPCESIGILAREEQR